LQAKELANLLALLRDYAQPTYDIFHKLYTEGAAIIAEEAIVAEQLALLEAEKAEEDQLRQVQTNKISQWDSIDEGSSGSDESTRSDYICPPPLKMHNLSFNGGASTSSGGGGSGKVIDKKGGVRSTVTLPSAPLLTAASGIAPAARRMSVMGKRPTGGSGIQLSYATLPAGCQNVPINFQHVRGFFGSNACQNLSIIMEGDESLEVKGIKYWKEQLDSLHETVNKVKDDIKVSLEEKRNFFSFILTVVTVGLAPMTILTGYW
jgi:hypothetical protein